MTSREPKDEVKSRFEFGSPDPNGSEISTISDLLSELNAERDRYDGTDLNLNSLNTTLQLLRSISGKKLKSTTEEHPIVTLKTVRLLYKNSRHIDSHLIRLIQPPGGNSLATLDFLALPPTEETREARQQIDHIIKGLEVEIPKDEIDQIDAICDPARLREAYRKDTNEAIDKILLTHIHIDDDLLKEADAYLAEQTLDFLTSMRPLEREQRLHVALYMHLKLLDYRHRLHFEISTQLSIPNDRGIKNKRVDFSRICQKLSEQLNKIILEDTNFMSLEEVSQHVEDNASDIAQLVFKATGFAYNKRDVPKDSARAVVVLSLYLAKAGLPNNMNTKPIGIVHVIAAFSSVLHQRKKKSKVIKSSRRYGLNITAPQKQLDAVLSKKLSHVPWTMYFVYAERTSWYVHALLGRKDKADSALNLKIAQSSLMRDVLASLDHALIKTYIEKYREFITRKAREFVYLHQRQDTTYQWVHGSN